MKIRCSYQPCTLTILKCQFKKCCFICIKLYFWQYCILGPQIIYVKIGENLKLFNENFLLNFFFSLWKMKQVFCHSKSEIKYVLKFFSLSFDTRYTISFLQSPLRSMLQVLHCAESTVYEMVAACIQEYYILIRRP